MRTEKEVRSKIDKLGRCLTYDEKKHNDLHQIDMLSGEGSQLRDKMSRTKGKISILQWWLEEEIQE